MSSTAERHMFGTPWSQTRYVPRYFRTEDDVITWDVGNTQNVADELEHLLACVRGQVFSLQVYTNAPGTSKIELIKKIRQDTGKGLKEAKDICDGHPLRNLSEADTVRYENAWSIYGARIRVFDSNGAQVRGVLPEAVRDDYADVPF
jgi:ribosomal protein L7/L12